jgi:predicted phosphodiesterase
MAKETFLAAVGDVHGHLQLCLCVLARWQRELGRQFDAVLLCGDVGTFTSEDQLDNATRRHARQNPCELEFLYQWAIQPQPRWLQGIFASLEEGGLGLTCPVIMVHGNHEGFAHLERLVPDSWPHTPVSYPELPAVDTEGHVRLLPSGGRVRLSSGAVIAGVGGVQPGQRKVCYHPMAYIDPLAVEWLLENGPVDVLVTHQGPQLLQKEKGAVLLDPLLQECLARVWVHGHSVASPDISHGGRRKETQVVPLEGIGFHLPRGTRGAGVPYEVGLHGWALVWLEDKKVHTQKTSPPFYREYRRHRWIEKEGLLVCPDLARWV